jgi:hypothetical protein
LTAKDYKRFWSNSKKFHISSATQHAATVGVSTGDAGITEMWRQHFSQVYNSVPDNGEKDTLEKRVSDGLNRHSECEVSVHHVIDACLKQKCGKAVGVDDVAMEAFLYGTTRLQCA